MVFSVKMTSQSPRAGGNVSSFSYDVVRQLPEDARAELCRLWTDNLQLEGKPEDRFRWLYRDAPTLTTPAVEPQPQPQPQPHRAGSVFLLRAVGADGVSQIVVKSGLTARKFQIGARYGYAALNGDLAVDKVHRGLLPALRLMKAACEHERATFDLGYGFPNAKAVGVLLRSGFRVLAKTTRYVRILRHAPYHRRLGQRPSIPPIIVRASANPVVAHTFGPVVDVARLARDAIPIARARRRYKLEWLTKSGGSGGGAQSAVGVGARFDELWDAARTEYDVLSVRSATFLSWRYPKADIAMLVRRDRAGKDNALAAYAIVERDAMTRAAHIRDVFGRKEALAPLVDLLLPSLWRRGAVSVSVRFIGAPYFADIIATRGFEARPEPQRTITMVSGDQTSAADRALLEDAKSWHLFDIDEDA